MSERDVYERLVKPIEDRMIRSVWRIVRNADDADDAFQDALLTIWKKWERIRRHPNPQALILRICIHSAYDFLRRKARDRKIEAREAIAEIIPNPSGSVSDGVATDEMKAAVYKAISKLPENQRMAVHLRYIEDLPYGPIAQVLGCREVSVRKRVSRALRKLRKILPQHAVEPSLL